MRILLYVLVMALVGAVVGYLLFARIEGNYIDINVLFGKRELLRDGILKVVGVDLEAIRTRIYFSAGVGAVIGAIMGASTRR